MPRERLIDARDGVPCEPLEWALAAAADLVPGEYVRLLLRREPVPLFAHLDARGCAWRSQPEAEGLHVVYFWRGGDGEAERAALARAAAP